eukprot:Plantae.Rhodophyta-Hildenbrandia_rubra.ctg18300.p1 GENE.Plantae.Rhodophyta-Hildenbrandia_rubra.ctg18300~~Plantae.Rhodophyta-Hildenbrandia_rubra.ctg18300.p1  ORF type:complete len:420 (+),score=47.90 Plantae.Rhodophyta-Hildenbrandia_rubra.ctg18300:2577-3836(+)
MVSPKVAKNTECPSDILPPILPPISPPKELINLGRGHPNPAYLSLSQVRSAFDQACAQQSVNSLLGYGRSQGPSKLCERIADWLRKDGIGGDSNVTKDNIVITAGASSGLALICQYFTQPGDTIVAESPVYFLAEHTFRDCSLEVVEVRSDANGLDVDELEEKLVNGLRPKMLYTVPLANNPTGSTMPDSNRHRLVALAQKYNFKIAADEVYMFLIFPEHATTAKSLMCFDDPQNPVVISINSFSKILGPGLRIGWLVAHQKFMKRILSGGPFMSGGGMNPMMGSVVERMMSNNYHEEQIQIWRETLKDGCETLCTALDQTLQGALLPGEKISYIKPTGGYFVFVNLPDRFDTQQLLEIARENHGVSFHPGNKFSPSGQGYSNCFRVCFAFYDPPLLEESINRLAQAVSDYTDRRVLMN